MEPVKNVQPIRSLKPMAKNALPTFVETDKCKCLMGVASSVPAINELKILAKAVDLTSVEKDKSSSKMAHADFVQSTMNWTQKTPKSVLKKHAIQNRKK